MTESPDAALIDAYSTIGARWQSGPSRIYDRLSQILVSASPVPVHGARVLDVGAGTGAAARAALAAGASSVLAVDPAYGMLALESADRSLAVVGDGRALPLRSCSVDLAVVAFSLNHLEDPARALEEIGRSVRCGGGVIAGTYALDDTHPAKHAVEDALGMAGWVPPGWYLHVREHVTPAVATVERIASLADNAGLVAVEVENRRVPFPELTPSDLVAWRLGMAQYARFVSTLTDMEERAVKSAALRRLDGASEPLVRSILVLRARTPSTNHSVDPRAPSSDAVNQPLGRPRARA